MKNIKEEIKEEIKSFFQSCIKPTFIIFLPLIIFLIFLYLVSINQIIAYVFVGISAIFFIFYYVREI